MTRGWNRVRTVLPLGRLFREVRFLENDAGPCGSGWGKSKRPTTYVIQPAVVFAVGDHLDGRVLPICNVEGVWDILCGAIFTSTVCYSDPRTTIPGVSQRKRKQQKKYQILQTKRAEALLLQRRLPNDVETVTRVVAQRKQDLDEAFIVTQLKLNGSTGQGELGAARDGIIATTRESRLFLVVFAGP